MFYLLTKCFVVLSIMTMVISLSACSTFRYTTPEGATVEYTRFLSDIHLGKMEAHKKLYDKDGNLQNQVDVTLEDMNVQEKLVDLLDKISKFLPAPQ